MAGFVGDERQWRKFEKRLQKLFARFRVNGFHAIDVKRSTGDFQGWSIDRKIEFLDEFDHIINETLHSGVAAFLQDDDYKFYQGLYWPTGTRQDTKYGLLFRACLSEAIDSIVGMPIQEPCLSIVLEDGHKNARDALRIYRWAQDRIGQAKALSGLTYGDKSSLPLAAADMFAYASWGQEVGQKKIGISKKPTKSDLSYRGNRARVLLNRDSLKSLHEQAISFANERRAARRRP